MRARVGALAAGIALALSVPGVAMAANTATFSRPTPTSATNSAVAPATISVSVYDRYGVKGSTSYAMTLDGRTVKASVKYAKRADYRRFTLTFRPAVALSVGTHTLSVKVKDLKKKSSTLTWKLPVAAAPVVVSSDPTPPTLPTLPGLPPLPPVVTPPAPPVLTPPVVTPPVVVPPVVVPPIVLPPVVVPIVVTTPVVTPPVVAPPAITPPVVTPPVVDPPVVTPPVVTEPDPTPDPTPPTLPIVVAAPTDPTPPGAPSGPATPVPPVIVQKEMPAVTMAADCRSAGCHDDANIVAIHKRVCSDCHGEGRPALTTVCATAGCHVASVDSLKLHPTYTSGHTAPTDRCITTACHFANVIKLHSTGTGAPGCAACHAPGRPALTLLCATVGCHAPAAGAFWTHAGAKAAHAVSGASGCAGPSCHGGATSVTAIHAKQGCSTCHKVAGAPLTANCTAVGCHSVGISDKHATHPSTVTSASFRINNLNYGTYACSTCHGSTDLIALHGGSNSCPKCHPGAADAAKPWDGTCTQPACHGVTSGRPMHAKVATAHVTAVQPGCTRDGCHFGNSSVGGKDVILVHFAKDKCTTCHGPGKTPTIDCIQCHPQAKTGDHQADHQACNDCHAAYVWDNATATANKGANLGNGPVSGVHWPMQDNVWTVLIGRATIRTGYPKGDYTMLVFPGKLGTPGTYVSAPYPAGNTGTYTCTTCHTGAGKTWVHPGSNYFTCGSGGDCHQHHGNWDPAENSETYVHNTPPASWTQILKW